MLSSMPAVIELKEPLKLIRRKEWNAQTSKGRGNIIQSWSTTTERKLARNVQYMNRGCP